MEPFLLSDASESKTGANGRGGSSNQSWVLWIMYLNIVIYSFCNQLASLPEPFLIRSLLLKTSNETSSISMTFGRLQALFYALQTVGAPMVGMLFDRMGVRVTSAIVFLACAISYFMAANATNLTTLFASKIPATLQAGFLVAQATASAVTNHQGEGQRAQALGRMTTAYSVGASLGPFVGGYFVALGDLYLGARMAALGSLLSVVLSLLFFPDTLKKPTASNQSEYTIPKSAFWRAWKHYGTFVAGRPILLPLLCVKFAGGIAASMYNTVLPLVLTQMLQIDPRMLGLFMSSNMLAVAVFGAFGMKPLVDWMGAPRMMRTSICVRALFLLLLATLISSHNTNTTELQSKLIQHSALGLSTIYGLGTHALATSLTTQTTSAVDSKEQGTLLGLEHGLFSMARIIGPPVGAILLTTCGSLWPVAVACGMIDLGLLSL